MATVPLSGTNIRIISGVPFSNDYKNTRWFDDIGQQSTYFNGKPLVHSMLQANFQRIEGQNYVSVNKSIDQLWGSNYMLFKNSAYNNKAFYGFVTKLQYINKETTYVHFEIDIFQTWCFEMNFKPSFIIREHCKQYNSDNGLPAINTVDEGLNYGTEYELVKYQRHTPTFGYKWLVIVAKEPFHNDANKDETAAVLGVPQPLSYYIIPFKNNGQVANIKDMTVQSLGRPVDILHILRNNESAVNNIVSMYVTDYIGMPVIFTEGSNGSIDSFEFVGGAADYDIETVTVGDKKLIQVKEVAKFRAIIEQVADDKYKYFRKPLESKLYMYPYCVIVLDDFKGNRLEIKPEHISGKPFELYVRGSLGTSNKVSYSVKNYNSDGSFDDQSSAHEHSLINNSPSDIPIINDMLAAFLQGNRNSIQNQLDSTVWNGITGALGGAGNVVGNAVSGNIGGAVGSGLGMVQGAGNSVLAIQGVEAKIKDIDNVPPSISKMGGNTIYESGNGFDGVYIMYKQIKHEYRKKLSDFFNMYGYKLNEVKIPNFHTRRNWNYVQTQSCTITGNFNNDDLVQLKSVFDNGITFWHTDDVGNYALENEVI